MRSQFIRRMDKQLITEEDTMLWQSKLKEDNPSISKAARLCL